MEDAVAAGIALVPEDRARDGAYLDRPVWENKAHISRPALADTDPPFMKFRKWYSQFYAEETTSEHTVFPPPYWPHKMDETPAKATASAKHGDNA